jgi:predicted acetyltransferase
MNSVLLVRPDVRFKTSYLEALGEFQAEGLAWMMHLDIEAITNGFDDFVAGELKKKTLWTIDEPVDETELWAIKNGSFVGRISIRHRLNKDLEIMGGHIGYDTRPTARGQGVASSMLQQALPLAKNLGVVDALLTCNDSNEHSIRIIEKNGGRLIEIKPQFEGGPMKRYYRILL